jgi:hypothetical protein
MIEFIVEIIKGMCISFGIVLGFLSLYVMVAINKKKLKYQPSDLINPFERYLEQIKQQEEYEQVSTVEQILIDLNKGIINDKVSLFERKKNSSIMLNTKDGNTEIKFINEYIVKGLSNEN